MSRDYDVIVIGAGHNGLVAAAYLARAGQRVMVLEATDRIGGACVTEELWPGFKVSTAAYVQSLFLPAIIRDLELARYGYELLPRNPSSFTPFPDGRSLLMGPDADLTRREVAKFSPRDADRLPQYEATLERVARFLEPRLDDSAAGPLVAAAGGSLAAGAVGLAVPSARVRRSACSGVAHRSGPPHPRSVVRVGRAQGQPGHLPSIFVVNDFGRSMGQPRARAQTMLAVTPSARPIPNNTV